MMEEELASLKRALISLVVSSPTTMTVNSLVKDYRNMVGGALPVAKFGYKDYITFLKERCQDIFVIEGQLRDPVLTPKVTKNLQHIDQMVQKQKIQSANKNKGKRTSVPGQRNTPVELNMIARTFNRSHAHQHNKHPPQHSKHPPQHSKHPPQHNSSGRNTPDHRQTQTATPKKTQIKENSESGHENIKNQSGHDIHLDTDPASSTPSDNNEKENINNIEESHLSSALSKFYKKRMPQYSSHMEFPSTEHVSSSHSSGSSSSRQSRLDELKGEILALITDSADGVWYTDLGRLYKERYGRELSFSGCGNTSISSVVSGLQDRVSISRPAPAGDWLLQDPSQARAAQAQAEAPGARRAALYRAPPPRALAGEPDDALPGIEFEADVFPADCMHYMDSVPGPAAAAAAEAEGEGEGAGAQFEVLIGEVYSPSHFWMLRVGARYNLAMEDIMDEMTQYYKGEGASRVLARGALRVGQHCAALYDGDWHRALVVKLVDSDTVKVRHVDYGTVDTVSAAALKPLKRCWGSLPAQALRARLACCRPGAAGRRWPRAACAAFLARVRDRRLYANVVAFDAEEDILETFLVDTSGPKDVCLSRELIRMGHADGRDDSALRSDDSYLYPRFEVLESGETLNYAEIQSALANGISLDYVDAYRRHVPDLRLPVAARADRPTLPAELQRPTPRAPRPPADPVPAPASPTVRPVLPAKLGSQTSCSMMSAEFQRPTFRPILSAKWPGPPPQAPPPRAPPPASSPPQLVELLPLLRLGEPAPPPGALAPGAEDEALQVRLGAAEWGVLAHLRATDPAAAHWYLLTAAWRPLLQPPPGF